MSDENNPAALVTYEAGWPRRASRLLSGVRGAIGGLDGAEAAALDHIGSTSVPGLAAKPFVDLQLRISQLPSETKLIARLAPFGYVRARGSRPNSPGVDRDLPRGSIEVDPLVWEKMLFWHEDHQAILHVRRADSPWGLYTIWFRNWLRANADARQRAEPPSSSTVRFRRSLDHMRRGRPALPLLRCGSARPARTLGPERPRSRADCRHHDGSHHRALLS